MEIELKLAIDPGDAARLLKDPLLKPATRGASRQTELANIYFDTPERELQQARIGLRLRRDGEQWLQTIKGGGQVSGGLHARQELEFAVAGRALEFAALDGSEWSEILTPERTARLQPVFSTDFQRTIRLIRPAPGVEIEVAIDRGDISAAGQNDPICEIELELKDGPVSALFDLALQLAERFELRLENASKAERGYRLAYGTAPRVPGKWAPPAIAAQTALPEAVATLAYGLLAHYQDNEKGFLGAAENPEFLHQMRVAIRRLRVLLGLFATDLPEPDTVTSLRGELRWLGNELGRARDWDVLLNDTLPTVLKAVGDHPAQARLHARLAAAGFAAQQAAREAVGSMRYQRLLLGLGRWCALLAAADGPASFGDAAAPLLGKYSRRLGDALKRADETSAATLHRTRILAKKLRYLGEFGALSYAGKRYQRFNHWLQAVQDGLGRHHDQSVADGLLATQSALVRRPDEAELLGMLLGWLRAQTVSVAHAELPKPFWK